MKYFIDLPMKMEPIVSSETSAVRTQTPGNYPKRNKLHLEHGESLKQGDQLFFNFATSVQRMRLQVCIIFQVFFSKMNPSVLDKVFGRQSMITDTSFAHILL